MTHLDPHALDATEPIVQRHFLPGDPQFTRTDLEPYLKGWSEGYLARLGHKSH